MQRLRTDSFQFRIFVAILVVALVPAAIAVAGGTLTLRTVGTRSGTLGAWDSVAESGGALVRSLDTAGVTDPMVLEAARRHRRALSESVRFSQAFAFIADRFVQVLPAVALLATLFLVGLALLTANRLARGFAAPITELVEWTERIGRGEPLPAPDAAKDEGVQELRMLRSALLEMSGQIEEGRRRAVEAARLRSWSDFARRVAHEIKNPLTPMKIAAVTLTRDADEPRREAGRILLEEIDRLDGMARSFAQYGKLPEGPSSEVDVTELLESLAELHGDRGIRIAVVAPGPVTLQAQLDGLRRAFENLLLNALEAQDGVTEAQVVLTVAATDGHVVVEIADRGPGVPEELMDDIWNPDVTLKRRGTGLGLPIVRQIVDVHGGTVAVSNRPEGGAAFRVTLPVGRDEEAP